jgi:hypothetical protein
MIGQRYREVQLSADLIDGIHAGEADLDARYKSEAHYDSIAANARRA